MRALTRQDHIDPLVQKVQKCYAPGCGPHGTQVLFLASGYVKHLDPIWACSSGHCSDYEDVPNLRKPEDDPVAWVKANAMEIVRSLPIELCHTHVDGGSFDADLWGQNGHLWKDGNIQELKLCLPQSI